MAFTVKNSFYWALTALQVAPEEKNNATNILSSDKLNCQGDFTKDKVVISDCPCDVENVKPTYSRDTVADHCTSDSCWMVINNNVYDVTRFLRLHPGGEDIILEHGGCDASTAFIDKGHSFDAYDSLKDYLIGEVTPEDRWPEKRIP